MFANFDPRQVSIDYWLGLAGMLGLIFALVWLRTRRPGAWQLALAMLAMFLLIRIVIVGNPVSWHIYSRILDAGDVGWRQYDLIRIQRDRYVAPRDGLRYLAVGSSQTEAVYAGYAQRHDDFDTFIVAAMMPMDFVLYADEIVRRRPATVLLYLSDFDIGKRPSAEALVVAPIQGADLPAVVWRSRALPGDADLQRAMFQLAVGEVLPEFKFRFVFRGIVDSYFRRMAAAVGSHERGRGQRSTINERIGWLRDSLGEAYVGHNLGWLEEFLRVMTGHGIDVVIVEGHYHPAVSNAETTRLASQVRRRLEQLGVTMPGVRYVPQSALGGLAADDYQDLTHVKPDAGDRVVSRLIAVLEQAPAASRASGGVSSQSRISSTDRGL